MKFILIVNPFSGKKQGLKILEKITPLFRINNIELNIIYTNYSGHAETLARDIDIENYNGLLLIGGDGTFHEVINGLLTRADNKKVPIGIIPAGSGNSFMRDLDITDPVKAINVIISNETRLIDVMRLEMEEKIQYSINLIGWGMVTDVGLSAEKMRWIGPSRYTIAALFQILFKKSRTAKLEIQGIKLETKFMFVIGCNSIHVGKGMKMAPKAKIDDGLVDIIVVESGISRLRLLSVLPKLYKGTHIFEPEVKYFQSDTFSLIPDNKDVLNIDGQIIGNTPIKVQVIPQTIEIFAPR
jgi:YegS/Rv2252/BmrU family lipid kinase